MLCFLDVVEGAAVVIFAKGGALGCLAEGPDRGAVGGGGEVGEGPDRGAVGGGAAERAAWEEEGREAGDNEGGADGDDAEECAADGDAAKEGAADEDEAKGCAAVGGADEVLKRRSTSLGASPV